MITITKPLQAAVVAGLLFLGACGPTPAAAQVTFAQGNAVDDHRQLIRTIEASGVEIQIDSSICNQFPMYGAYFHKNRIMVLCSRGDQAERLDTLRHETWHLIQDAKDCDLSDHDMKTLIKPSEIPEEAKDRIRRLRLYPESDVALEAEATAAADELSASELTSILRNIKTACNGNFR